MFVLHQASKAIQGGKEPYILIVLLIIAIVIMVCLMIKAVIEYNKED